MRKLRTKLMVSAGTVATVSGIAIAMSPQAAHATTIVLHPILTPLIDLVLGIPL